MPFALESDKYIFVHGGIPHGETLESAGPWRCMKINSFYAARPHFKKWVITGHTPVCLYGTNTISAVPVVDPACRVASIDGGCVLKDDGQLNALILRRGKFTSEWYDPFPLGRALDAQKKARARPTSAGAITPWSPLSSGANGAASGTSARGTSWTCRRTFSMNPKACCA